MTIIFNGLLHVGGGRYSKYNCDVHYLMCLCLIQPKLVELNSFILASTGCGYSRYCRRRTWTDNLDKNKSEVFVFLHWFSIPLQALFFSNFSKEKDKRGEEKNDTWRTKRNRMSILHVYSIYLCFVASSCLCTQNCAILHYQHESPDQLHYTAVVGSGACQWNIHAKTDEVG